MNHQLIYGYHQIIRSSWIRMVVVRNQQSAGDNQTFIRIDT